MNIYDEKLRLIEKAEERVRIAEEELAEAEKELDDVLDFVECQIETENCDTSTVVLTEMKLLDPDKWGIKVLHKDKKKGDKRGSWYFLNTNGKPDGGEIKQFDTKQDAEKSPMYKNAKINYANCKIVSHEESDQDDGTE